MRQVLLLRPGALGDAVLTLPVLHALKSAGARGITILGNPASWSFLRKEVEGLALSVHDLGASDWLGLFAAGGRLSQKAHELLARCDLALVYLGPDCAAAEHALKACGIQDVRCIDPPKTGARTAGPADEPGPGQIHAGHAARRLLDSLKAFLSDAHLTAALLPEHWPQARDVFISITPEETRAALSRLGVERRPAGGVLALHPGSGGQAKCWPAERYAALAKGIGERRGLTPLVFFGPADEDVRRAFDAALPQGLRILRAAHFPLREVMALLALSRAFVGNDAGVTHLAARCCPALALFGPTDPRVWRPLGGQVNVLASPTSSMAALDLETVLESLNMRCELTHTG